MKLPWYFHERFFLLVYDREENTSVWFPASRLLPVLVGGPGSLVRESR